MSLQHGEADRPAGQRIGVHDAVDRPGARGGTSRSRSSSKYPSRPCTSEGGLTHRGSRPPRRPRPPAGAASAARASQPRPRPTCRTVAAVAGTVAARRSFASSASAPVRTVVPHPVEATARPLAWSYRSQPVTARSVGTSGCRRGRGCSWSGMHRSGTSALTGALGRLGLALPAADDLVAGRYDNPVHYESRALTDLDDATAGRARRERGARHPTSPRDGSPIPPCSASRRARPRAARRAFPHDGPVRVEGPPPVSLAPAVAGAAPATPSSPCSCGAPRWPWPGRSDRGRASPEPGPGPVGALHPRRAGRPGRSRSVYVLRYEELLADPGPHSARWPDWLAADGAYRSPGRDGRRRRGCHGVARAGAPRR